MSCDFRLRQRGARLLSPAWQGGPRKPQRAVTGDKSVASSGVAERQNSENNGACRRTLVNKAKRAGYDGERTCLAC